MEYNSSRERLIIPAYGRNVQKIANYILTLENKEQRTNLAKTLVNIMIQISNEPKDNPNIQRKVWDHLYMITNYKLDINSPFPKPDINTLNTKPQKLNYPQGDIKFKPYGKTIANIIEKVSSFEDGFEKDTLILNIANHLKKSYLNWNRDSVNDELITEHLKVLSKGKLELKNESKLSNTRDLLSQNNNQNKKKKILKKRKKTHDFATRMH